MQEGDKESLRDSNARKSKSSMLHVPCDFPPLGFQLVSKVAWLQICLSHSRLWRRIFTVSEGIHAYITPSSRTLCQKSVPEETHETYIIDYLYNVLLGNSSFFGKKSLGGIKAQVQLETCYKLPSFAR